MNAARLHIIDSYDKQSLVGEEITTAKDIPLVFQDEIAWMEMHNIPIGAALTSNISPWVYGNDILLMPNDHDAMINNVTSSFYTESKIDGRLRIYTATSHNYFAPGEQVVITTWGIDPDYLAFIKQLPAHLLIAATEILQHGDHGLLHNLNTSTLVDAYNGCWFRYPSNYLQYSGRQTTPIENFSGNLLFQIRQWQMQSDGGLRSVKTDQMNELHKEILKSGLFAPRSLISMFLSMYEKAMGFNDYLAERIRKQHNLEWNDYNMKVTLDMPLSIECVLFNKDRWPWIKPGELEKADQSDFSNRFFSAPRRTFSSIEYHKLICEEIIRVSK
jgi:hypothetical protein